MFRIWFAFFKYHLHTRSHELVKLLKLKMVRDAGIERKMPRYCLWTDAQDERLTLW